MPKSSEIKKANIELFRKTAQCFEEKNTELFNVYEQRSLMRRLRKANRTCKKHQIYCDLGCGTGNFIEKQIPEFQEVIGLDITRGMISVCKAKGLGDKACFLVADAENLPFQDNVFDMVTMHAALHHVPSPLSCLREIYRVLPNDGIMYIDHEQNTEQMTSRRWKLQGIVYLIVEIYARKHRNDQSQSDPLVPPECRIADVQLKGFIPKYVREWLQSIGFCKAKTTYQNVFSPHFFDLPPSFKILSLMNDVLGSFPLIRRYCSHICIWARK
jgi:ubiquinone/menaquinone biosynthesis C-methylase UbiE